MGVTSTSFLLRSKRRTPSSSSSLASASESVGWVTKHFCAARPKWRSWARATTYRSSVRVMAVSIGVDYRKYNHNQLDESIRSQQTSLRRLSTNPETSMLPNREGQRVPAGHLSHPSRQPVGRRDHRPDLRRTHRRRVRPARRLHPDVLDHPPAPLQRARAHVLEAGRRRDRVPVGERRLRDGRMAEGPGRAQRHVHPGRQRRIHREDGHARRQGEPGLRQALVALFDAREGRRRREAVHRAREGRRPLRGLGRGHDAQVPRARREGAGARRRLHQARLPALRARQGAARGERRGLRGSRRSART